MAVNPMLSIGAEGIDRAMAGAERAAARIAGAERPGGSPESSKAERVEPGSRDQAEALLELKTYERQVQASAKVVKTADATIGFLLDTRA